MPCCDHKKQLLSFSLEGLLPWHSNMQFAESRDKLIVLILLAAMACIFLRRAAPIPTRYPPGSNGGPSGSLLSDNQPGSNVELYGPSRSIFRNGPSLSRHSRAAADPRGSAVHRRGSIAHPRHSATDPRAGGQHARGRGSHHRGRSAGRSKEHHQQTRASSSSKVQPVSGSARAHPAAQPKGQHSQHGSNRGHQGSHRQLREPDYQADVVSFPYAQQSGYPC